MEVLSERILSLTESATLAMTRKSRELVAAGRNIINLSIGEPDFNTPDFVKVAAHEAIDQNYSHYPPVSGYPELLDAIITKFKRDNGLHFTRDQILVSTGAKHSIANVVLSVVNPGDEVLLPAPYWVSYSEIIRLAGGIPVEISTSIENDFKITNQQLSDAITSKTKMMIYSSPCNPTGSVYSEQELRSIAEVLAPHKNIYVISDEIYEHINFIGPHFSIGAVESIADRVITVNGVSKAFAMTGWRIGYLGASKEIAQACVKMQGQFTSGACTIAQRAAIAALLASPTVTHTMKEAFLQRRNFVLAGLRTIPGLVVNEPEGAFYVFPEVSSYFGKSYAGTTIKDANDLCLFLLDQADVALVSGDSFGAPGYFRISYATSEENLKAAVTQIGEALSKLQ